MQLPKDKMFRADAIYSKPLLRKKLQNNNMFCIGQKQTGSTGKADILTPTPQGIVQEARRLVVSEFYTTSSSSAQFNRKTPGTENSRSC